MSPASVSHMEKIYSMVRKVHGRSPTDELNGLDVNNAVWCIFMNVTLQVAVHLGRDYVWNLRLTTNQLLKSVKQLFQVTESWSWIRQKSVVWPRLITKNGVRVENTHTIHYIGHYRRDSNIYYWITVWTWAVQMKDHLHVDVQRHWLVKTRKHRKMFDKFCYSCELCSQIPARTLVIFGNWIREEMVRDLFW